MQPNRTEHSPDVGSEGQVENKARRALTEWRAKINADRQEWLDLLAGADELIAKIDGLLEDLPCEPTGQMTLGSESLVTGGEPDYGQEIVKDIRHCKTQPEAARAIAEKNGGVIRLGEVAEIIVAAGKGQSKRTVNSTLHNVLSASDEWEKVAPGTFRLVTLTDDS